MDNHEKIKASSKALTKYYSYVYSVGGRIRVLFIYLQYFLKDTKADTYPVLLRTGYRASTRLVSAVCSVLLEFKKYIQGFT